MKIQFGLTHNAVHPSSDFDGYIADGAYISTADLHHEMHRLEKERKKREYLERINRRSEPDITWLRKFMD